MGIMKKAKKFKSTKKPNTVWLEPELWEIVRVWAYDSGNTLSDCVAELIAKENKNKKRRRKVK